MMTLQKIEDCGGTLDAVRRASRPFDAAEAERAAREASTQQWDNNGRRGRAGSRL